MQDNNNSPTGPQLPQNTQLGGGNFFSSLFAPQFPSSFLGGGLGDPSAFFGSGSQASTMPLSLGTGVPAPPQFSGAQLSPDTSDAQNPTFAFGRNLGQGRFVDNSQGTVFDQYINQLQALAEAFSAMGQAPPPAPPVFNIDLGGLIGPVSPGTAPVSPGAPPSHGEAFGGIPGPRTPKVNPNPIGTTRKR